jgi:hypothetical protein
MRPPAQGECLNNEKKQQILAPGLLGGPLGRIQQQLVFVEKP